MKIKVLLLSVLVFSFAFQCDDEEPEQNNVQPDSLKASFNGQTVDFAYFPEAGDITFDGSNLTGLFISGNNEQNNKSLYITLAPFTGVGEYVLDGIYTDNYAMSIDYHTSPPGGGVVTDYALFDGLSGVVTITQFDGEIVKGTFQAEIKCSDCNGNVEMITVLNGLIDLEYVGEFY